jgi:hypothetical protein
MITAAYTLCKNEIKKIDQWLHYTKDFDYRVILDTGSTDGSFETFQKVPNIIIDQYIMAPEEFSFDICRNKNLAMVPENVDWCLSPDVDEYFSINVLDEIEKTIKNYSNVTNIACTRLDIYSKEVFVGPPKHLGSNKIHRRHEYTWRHPIYEHLSYIKGFNEVEIFNKDIFLVHDQDVSKPRSTLYKKLLIREHKNNPSNSWNSWFLANEYYREKDLENFVVVGLDFIANTNRHDGKFKEVLGALQKISWATNVPEEIKTMIRTRLMQENIH